MSHTRRLLAVGAFKENLKTQITFQRTHIHFSKASKSKSKSKTITSFSLLLLFFCFLASTLILIPNTHTHTPVNQPSSYVLFILSPTPFSPHFSLHTRPHFPPPPSSSSSSSAHGKSCLSTTNRVCSTGWNGRTPPSLPPSLPWWWPRLSMYSCWMLSITEQKPGLSSCVCEERREGGREGM